MNQQEQKIQEAASVPGVAVAANAAPAVPAASSKAPIVYQADGEEVTLTRDLVRQYLTRGDGAVTEGEVVMFISLCKANKLNPFVGDCFLIKYGNKPAQMVTSKEAFMKRAESGAGYQGFEAGVIVAKGEDIDFEEGAFIPPKSVLLGGWCTVFREGRKPVRVRVSLSEYSTGKSTWAGMPATMIRKVAIAQAFREAYPLNVGGLYTPEEMDQAQRPDDQPQPEPERLPANSQEVPMPPQEAAVPDEPEKILVPEPEVVEAQAQVAEPDNGVETLDDNLFKV